MDFFETDLATRPIPTKFKDVFLRRDLTPEEVEIVNQFHEKMSKQTNDDDAFDLFWEMFSTFAVDKDGKPFDNTKEDMRKRINAIVMRDFIMTVYEEMTNLGKPTKSPRRRS